MNRWITEDWDFTITVTRGAADRCRLGFETGDRFTCQYAVPTGFCPKTMGALYTLCEIIRCGGDFRLKGSGESHGIDFVCADGCISFHLTARPAGREAAAGNTNPNQTGGI